MYLNSLQYNGSTYLAITSDELLAKGVPEEVIVQQMHIDLGRQIDSAAGLARAAFVSDGAHIDQEYLLAKQDAGDWLAGGKDEGAIPASVADHMAMTGQSAEEAAQEIVATAGQWEQALGAIRSLRLGGKSAVRKTVTIDAAFQAARDAITQLNAFRPQ